MEEENWRVGVQIVNCREVEAHAFNLERDCRVGERHGQTRCVKKQKSEIDGQRVWWAIGLELLTGKMYLRAAWEKGKVEAGRQLSVGEKSPCRDDRDRFHTANSESSLTKSDRRMT